MIRNAFELENTDDGSYLEYTINEGILFKLSPGRRYKIMVPTGMVEKLFTEVHKADGHIGSRKLISMLAEYFYLKSMSHVIRKILSYCNKCQRNKYCTGASMSYQQAILSDFSHELLAIEFFGPLPASRGNVKYILVTIDTFTKYVVTFLVRNVLYLVQKITYMGKN